VASAGSMAPSAARKMNSSTTDPLPAQSACFRASSVW
jgi:hypothetical protein